MKSIITVDIKESDLLTQARALFAQEEAAAPEQVATETAPVAQEEATPVETVSEEVVAEETPVDTTDETTQETT